MRMGPTALVSGGALFCLLVIIDVVFICLFYLLYWFLTIVVLYSGLCVWHMCISCLFVCSLYV